MKKIKCAERGFTLIEVMVVVVILGLLAAIIVPNVIGRAEEARISKVKQDIVALENALEMYKLDNGDYPTTDQGLNALVVRPDGEGAPNWRVGGYIKRLPNDPWNHPYQYLNPGIHGEIDIYSYGKSGGTNKTDSIIGNWTINGTKQ